MQERESSNVLLLLLLFPVTLVSCSRAKIGVFWEKTGEREIRGGHNKGDRERGESTMCV